jgi:hypothetical protein
MRTLAYFAVLMVLAVLIALVGSCTPAPAPSFPVYQEGRAFPSCTVPIYVSASCRIGRG